MPDLPTPTPYSVPEKPTVDGLEAAWTRRWDQDGTYRFDPETTREDVFSIDTPPPTVSGELHIGHVFSYTQGDVVARFWRMRGKNVFYPLGWDDNGVPTERRVENYYGVRCDPSLPFDPHFSAPEQPDDKKKVSIARGNFVELCEELTRVDEEAFKHLFRSLGQSVDWSTEYTTVGRFARGVSQRAFLNMLARDDVYLRVAPTLWDVDFKMAVSQAELEDREQPSAYHRLSFARVGSEGAIEVDTTRPELLASCVAVVAHPEDPRFTDLFGTSVLTPLFGIEVPVVAHELADPDKGTGAAMICTFGDTTDVTWWRELALPTRTLIGRDGRFLPADFTTEEFPSRAPGLAASHYAGLEGRNVKQARAAVVEALRVEGSLLGEPREITHPVKFYEKGERPLEIVASRQWFVRTLEHREELLARGEELNWVPDFMRHRYRTWVEGLNTDWNISRQRYFGVPFPVWYPIDAEGEIDFGSPLLPSLDRLPIDPSSDLPEGYQATQRDRPLGFSADPDIMDTWATSSLSPQIAGRWGTELFERVFPMDLRLQAHEIIRTWLFATVVRSHLEFDSLPFENALISGWILDPNRKKMSKSKGNVVTPLPLIENHGADAVRYWAASGRPGTDTAIDEGQMKIGRRLAIKMLNASKFVLGRLDAGEELNAGDVTLPLDQDLLALLGDLIDEATAAFEKYDYARVLERAESFFWSFCDNYVELAKARAYGEGSEEETRSARATLFLTLSALQRIFAPIQPFVTEEVWSWWHDSSIHLAPWPTRDELGNLRSHPGSIFQPVCEVLEAIRREKSSAKVSQRAEVADLVIAAPQEYADAVSASAADLQAAGNVTLISVVVANELAVSVTLAPA
ncbi:MAG TPA: valine--tRNA ligase [Acidimicrobiales bacterium]